LIRLRYARHRSTGFRQTFSLQPGSTEIDCGTVATAIIAAVAGMTVATAAVDTIIPSIGKSLFQAWASSTRSASCALFGVTV
jgi:hypothetical protein